MRAIALGTPTQDTSVERTWYEKDVRTIQAMAVITPRPMSTHRAIFDRRLILSSRNRKAGSMAQIKSVMTEKLP